MKHLIKAVERERFNNTISWDLTFYDDDTMEIKTINEIEVKNE